MENPVTMAESLEDPIDGEVEVKPMKRYKKLGYKAVYVPKESSALETQLAVITGMAESTIRGNNSAWWVHCCSTIVRNIDLSSLGHPQHQVVPIRKLFQARRIKSQQEFKDYLLGALPKNDVGLVFLPEVNMEHPGNIKVKIEEDAADPDIKMEEEALEEERLNDQREQLLQTILAKQQEQDAKLNEVLQ